MAGGACEVRGGLSGVAVGGCGMVEGILGISITEMNAVGNVRVPVRACLRGTPARDVSCREAQFILRSMEA
jgi:TRAP-type C4-dicarboxylate transport system permease large subunit